MLNAIIAFAIGVAVFAVALWAIRLLATPPPPEPDPDDVLDVDLPFVCTVCGLQLTVTQAQDAEVKAPRHCREEMVPV